MDCTTSPKMETFVATRQALSSLEQSLQCSACQQLLTEPCTLGNCDHLICKSCAEKFTGNSCPACKAPAWAKDLQVKRELGMVVRLYRRLCRLISSKPEQTQTTETSSSKNVTDGIGNTATDVERVPGADGNCDQDGLGWTGAGNKEEEDMDLFEDGEDEEKEDVIRGGGDASGDAIQTESETEPMSISESDEPTETWVNQKLGHAVGSETEPMSTSESDGTETEGKVGKKKRKLLSVNMLSGSKSNHGRETGRKRAAVDSKSGTTASVSVSGKENGAISVYDFEASPPRPKTRRMKVQVKQQTRREVNLKKLAAANKTWSAVSGKRVPSSTNGKHVSFSDDSSMKSESSSAETVGPVSKGMPQGRTRNKKANEPLAKGKKQQPEKQSRSNGEEAQLTQLKSKGGKSNAGKGEKAATNNSKKISQVTKSSPKAKSNPKQKGKSGKATTKSAKEGQNTGHKRQPQCAKNSKHSPDLEEDDEDEVATTPKSSCKASGKRRSLTGAGVTSSPNSSFSSPKNPLTKRNKRGETPLHVACIKGDVSEVQSLLKQGADPNSRDNAGWTPLHEACNHGHSTLLSLLLDNGALINAPGGFEHDSPLHDAVNNNRLDVICFLRQRGASLETRNIHGHTPLDLASTPKMREALMTAPLNAQTQPSHDAPSASPAQHLRDRPVVLLGTGLKPKEKSALQRCADLLGGRVVDDFSPDVTHLVAACEEEGAGLTCLRTMKYMQAVLAGRWVVNFSWVQKCIKKRERVAEAEFEIPGTTADPDSNAAMRARENLQKQFPGLFDGCHFYFWGAFNHPTPPKNELTQLIKLGGGVILNRQPKMDDDVIQSSSVVPYHTKADSALASCPYYILYDHLGRKAPLEIRARKVCTVPVYWLLDCISQFAILEPPRV